MPVELAEPVQKQGIPFVVSLDALVRTRLGIESVFAALAASPMGVLAGCVALASDRAGFWRRIDDLAAFDAATLPYDEAALARIAQARRNGQPIYLAAAADDRLAQAVARHLGLDGIAQGAPSAAQRMPRLSRPPRLRRIFDAMRPEQWSKNLLVFVPVLTSLELNAASLIAAAELFVAFSLCASAGYIFNDLIDLSADRQHPQKQRRPFASSDVPLAFGLGLIPALLAAAGAVALLLPLPVAFSLLAYLAATIAYSLALKQKLMLDVITLAALYTLRVYAGAIAIGVPLSGWLLLFSIFIFISLALVKRCSEITLRLAAALGDPVNRAYEARDLPALLSVAAAAAFSAAVIFALYVESDAVRAIYSRPETLLFVVPVLVYWLVRLIMLAYRGLIVVDPVVFALRDRASWACAVATAAIMASAV